MKTIKNINWVAIDYLALIMAGVLALIRKFGVNIPAEIIFSPVLITWGITAAAFGWVALKAAVKDIDATINNPMNRF